MNSAQVPGLGLAAEVRAKGATEGRADEAAIPLITILWVGGSAGDQPEEGPPRSKGSRRSSLSDHLGVP